MLHFFVSLYLLHFVSSQNTLPSITDGSSPSPVIKNVNESVSLECVVRNLQGYSVTWSKTGSSKTIQIAANNARLINDPRFSVSLENTSSVATYRLNIKDLQAKDAGEFHCSVPLESNDDISRKIVLQIRAPPYIHGDSPQTIYTTINNSTKLECYTTGYPNPNITWKRENNANLPNGKPFYAGNVLKIDKVQKADAGVYICVADNKVGTVQKRFTLTVYYAPFVKAVKGFVEQALKYKAKIECEIDSSPAPSVTWIRDNIPIPNNQYYEISLKAADDHYTASLKIDIQERKLYGEYTCRVNNTIGEGHAKIELKESSKEVCAGEEVCSSGQSIISLLDLKLSFTSVIILMFNWQNM